MQQDDQYHGADMSGRPYTYPTPDGQPHHALGNPKNYYELDSIAHVEPPLQTQYPGQSQRNTMHPTQYKTVYDTSNDFHGENYHLSQQSSASEGAYSHTSAHPFSRQPSHGAIPNVDGNFYDPLNSHLGEMGHTYMPDMSLTAHVPQRHDASNDFQSFTYAQAPNEAYMPVPHPPMGNTAGRITTNLPAQRLKRRPPTEEFMQGVTTARGLSFDLKYTQHASLGSADQPGLAYLENHELPFPASHRPDTTSDKSNSTIPDDTISAPVGVVKKKKSKMHDCEICGKKFPRPSGLRTHMNTHNNVKPYPCTFPGCTRSFAVRSNAKRHLRTHGIIPPPAVPSSSLASPSAKPYAVGFSPPTIVQGPEYVESHQMARAPVTLKWMPPSLSTRTNAARLRSFSDVEESDVEEDDDDYEEVPRETASDTRERSAGVQSERGEGPSKNWKLNRSGRLALSIPLRAVVPTSPSLQSPFRCAPLNQSISLCGANSECCARYEERNSFREAGSHPYHPSQFRTLPGPAILRPPLMV